MIKTVHLSGSRFINTIAHYSQGKPNFEEFVVDGYSSFLVTTNLLLFNNNMHIYRWPAVWQQIIRFIFPVSLVSLQRGLRTRKVSVKCSSWMETSAWLSTCAYLWCCFLCVCWKWIGTTGINRFELCIVKCYRGGLAGFCNTSGTPYITPQS